MKVWVPALEIQGKRLEEQITSFQDMGTLSFRIKMMWTTLSMAIVKTMLQKFRYFILLK